ncbi:hypothetical protein [Treponema denticola]|uniref:hypothetical protein n=1 Tax=Treponema denticola TaxID=158 RepID=UPI0002B587BF|nr:hypothetical protein [Treponema denticola]EMB22846.1 hypothetical protein HMPREF9724_01790 [Treponema denticola SP37]EPF32685.1 hypothetical protein HMPREF9734_02001 [Treponema denticola SP44]EPF40781.1 hypothetical protein HMPREF9731_00017 [Treponema denticola SP23]
MGELDQNNGNQTPQGNGSGETQATGTSVLDAFKGAGTGSNQNPATKGDENAKGGQANKEAETYALKAWGAQLSKELKENEEAVKVLSKFEDISGLANSYIELEKKQGSMHTIPGEKATQEELDAFYKRLGKPEAADKYSFDQKYEAEKRFAEAAFKANLSDKQAKELYDFFLNIGQSQQAQYKEIIVKKAQETDALLQKEYGKDFDNKMASYTKGLKLLGGGEVMKQLEETGLAYDPGFVKLMINAGEALGESKAVIGNGTTPNGIKSAREGGTFSFFNE